MTPIKIRIKGVSKSFSGKNKGESLEVLDNINLDIKEGEFITIIGPNSCGKTTFLNIISSLEKPDLGTIIYDNVNNYKKKVGYVFQNYYESLFPWLTVLENIEFGLVLQGFDFSTRRNIVKDLVDRFYLSDQKEQYPYQLSGGKKQLVAILRALAYQPDILILDEPFTSLDYDTARNMWLELERIWSYSGGTFLFVSHDINEAVFLSDRVIVFSKRPAKIIEEVEIDLARPRTLSMLRDNKFLDYRKKVLEIFDFAIK